MLIKCLDEMMIGYEGMGILHILKEIIKVDVKSVSDLLILIKHVFLSCISDFKRDFSAWLCFSIDVCFPVFNFRPYNR